MMNVVIGAMISIGEKEMKIYEKIQDYEERIALLQKELEDFKRQYTSRILEINESWKEIQSNKSNEWTLPTIEQIFNRRVVDNGDRFHHYDKEGYKRTRRVGRFDNNYHNAEIASKRQQNLDRIAQWAVLDEVKQDVIDDFIIKYDLSAIEIARFENVMLVAYSDTRIRMLNIWNDAWYAACYRRFDSNTPFGKS